MGEAAKQWLDQCMEEQRDHVRGITGVYRKISQMDVRKVVLTEDREQLRTQIAACSSFLAKLCTNDPALSVAHEFDDLAADYDREKRAASHRLRVVRAVAAILSSSFHELEGEAHDVIMEAYGHIGDAFPMVREVALARFRAGLPPFDSSVERTIEQALERAVRSCARSTDPAVERAALQREFAPIAHLFGPVADIVMSALENSGTASRAAPVRAVDPTFPSSERPSGVTGPETDADSEDKEEAG